MPEGESVEFPHLCRVGLHRYEIGCEAVRGNGTAPVIPCAHTHTSAYAHGQSRVFAHKEKVRRSGVGEVAELVVIEHVDNMPDGVGMGFGRRFGFAVDIDYLVVGCQRVGMCIYER